MTCWHARSATTRCRSSLSPAISVITPTIRAACGGRFFALAQGGFLRAGGVFIKGGSRTLSMKLAKVVMKARGSVLLGREAIGVDTDARGRAAFVRYIDPKMPGAVERVGAKVLFANCSPNLLAGLLGTPSRGHVERAYGARAPSTSLFTAHFGISAPPVKFGLDRYGTITLPEWTRSRLSRVWRRSYGALVPQCALRAQFPQHARRRSLRLRADAAAARHLGRLPSLAPHADSGALSRFVVRRLRRLHGRNDVGGRGCAGSDEGMDDLDGRYRVLAREQWLRKTDSIDRSAFA